MFSRFQILGGLVVTTRLSEFPTHNIMPGLDIFNQHMKLMTAAQFIFDTFSSIVTFVPPYSGSKTLSPTFTLTGTTFPL